MQQLLATRLLVETVIALFFDRLGYAQHIPVGANPQVYLLTIIPWTNNMAHQPDMQIRNILGENHGRMEARPL
jgi:hypothetical protein